MREKGIWREFFRNLNNYVVESFDEFHHILAGDHRCHFARCRKWFKHTPYRFEGHKFCFATCAKHYAHDRALSEGVFQ